MKSLLSQRLPGQKASSIHLHIKIQQMMKEKRLLEKAIIVLLAKFINFLFSVKSMLNSNLIIHIQHTNLKWFNTVKNNEKNAMWKKYAALHKQGASSFQLGCVCHSVKGEVCAQSQALSSTLRQCSSEGCCSHALGRVQLCPSSKVGRSNFIFMITKGMMSALCHPDPFAQKMDPEDDILNFHFPFKCH